MYKIIGLFFLSVLIMVGCEKADTEKIAQLDIHPYENISWSDKRPFGLAYTYQDATDSLQGKIKYRGGYSSRFGKHSFTFKLEEKRPLANLPEDNDWILNASYIDKTFMRHKISYELFREMSSENIAPRCAYVNLAVSGQEQGLYILMERMDGSRLKLDKRDSLAMIFKDPPIFFKDSLAPQDSGNYHHQKFPKMSKSDHAPFMAACHEFLFYAPDQNFRDSIGLWFDLQNVIDWHLIIRFANNSDGVLKNFYLYKQDSETPLRFAIWDYDHSFGRDGDGELNMNERHEAIDRNVLLTRLLETNPENYRQRLADRYFQMREKGIFSKHHFDEKIAENTAIIGSHLPANFQLWPVDSEHYYDGASFEEEVQIMKDFMDLRLEFLDNYFAQLSTSE